MIIFSHKITIVIKKKRILLRKENENRPVFKTQICPVAAVHSGLFLLSVLNARTK